MGKGTWLKECAFVYLQLHVNLTWAHNLGLIIYLENLYLSLEEGTWLKEHAFSFCCLNASWFWVHGLGSIISFDGYCLFLGERSLIYITCLICNGYTNKSYVIGVSFSIKLECCWCEHFVHFSLDSNSITGATITINLFWNSSKLLVTIKM
jgi:hypothetical protein